MQEEDPQEAVQQVEAILDLVVEQMEAIPDLEVAIREPAEEMLEIILGLVEILLCRMLPRQYLFLLRHI